MRFGVLGPLEVTLGNARLDLGSAKQRRLLATLLVQPRRSIAVDRLIEILWAGEPPRSAEHGLQTYIHRLRASFGDDREVIVTRSPGYLLAVADDQIDAGRFESLLRTARDPGTPAAARLEQLDRALGLWRGPAFSEFANEDPFRAEAVRLEEQHRVAHEVRFEAMLTLERHEEAVAGLEALAEQEPLRERPRQLLMLARFRSGHHADAVAVARDFRRLLLEDAGLEPSAAFDALERAVLAGEPSLERPSQPDPGSARRLPNRPAQLPREATTLVGRDHDVTRVGIALDTSRLVTVTGVGGVGKTRLALHVARARAGDLPHGAWWCELAELGEPDEVAEAVATALGIGPSDADDVTTAIATLLAARHGLLVLDNGEHVLRGVAPLVEAVLERSSQVRVLVTSRAPLGITGERIHRLSPLAVEVERSDEQAPALVLLEERSRAMRPEFPVDQTDRRAMLEICRRLDGLPLAIELAASRLRTLNPTDLLTRLDDRPDLLEDRHQPEERHRGLAAVIDWSYSLLSTGEQQLFDRLSVFAGAFTLEAAEDVAVGDRISRDEILDLLSGLVDHSLVTILPTGGASRYTLLQTLRSHGRAHLGETDQEPATRRRHAEYHVGLAESADEQVRSRDEALGVARLDRSTADLRATHRWTLAHGEVDLALRLNSALLRYALFRLRSEMLGWAMEAASLPTAATHPRFPVVAGMAGWAAGLAGDLDTALRWAERGLAATRDRTDPRILVPLEVRMHAALWQGQLDDCRADAARARALTADPYELVPHYVPGLALTYDGHPGEALSLMDEVQARADRHGNPSMRALSRYTRAEALLVIDPPAARPVLEDAIRIATPVDNRMVLGVADVSLLSLQAHLGATDDALVTLTAVIDRLYDAGDWTHLWTGLRSLVGILTEIGQGRDAATLLAAVRETAGAPPVYGADAERLGTLARRLEESLGRAQFTEAQAEGRAMDPHELIAFVRAAIT